MYKYDLFALFLCYAIVPVENKSENIVCGIE